MNPVTKELQRTMDPLSSNGESAGQRGKRIIAEMSNVRTLIWVGIALVIHAAIILGTSFGYLREKLFHTPPAAAVADQTPAPATPAAPVAAPAAKTANSTAAPAGVSDDAKLMAERANSPTVKAVTATDKPDELPKGPSINPLKSDDDLLKP